ncbi:hypothetical protein HY636_00885 [Candidatus Woesearchaeota archaeon]|nr:hypothetical protein [Candidatus Woesearchaeota archaeon]
MSNNYFGEDHLKAWRDASEKHKNSKFVKKIFLESKKIRQRHYKIIKEIEKTNFKNVSKKRLLKLFKDYYQSLVEIRGMFTISAPNGTYYVEQQIKNLLSEINDEKKEKEVNILIITPAKLDLIQREKIEWLKLVSKKYNDKILMQHAKTYASFFFNTYDEKFVLDYLRNKAKKESIHELKDEVKKTYIHLNEVKNKQKTLFSKFDKKLKYYAQILQNHAIDRFELKNCWSGAEFLALSMFKKLSRLANISIHDFMQSYYHEDIERLITKGTRLSKDEITRRKICFACYFHDDKLLFKSGDEAEELIKQLLEKREVLTKELKGMTASSGNVKGITKGTAKVVLVTDLAGFVKDLSEFKKGEILVTTMTTPNMVVIMKKASGIVTDEGGICSHAAVVSRELNLPCIVGTKDATRTIKTGDIIEIDTTSGNVKIIG